MYCPFKYLSCLFCIIYFFVSPDVTGLDSMWAEPAARQKQKGLTERARATFWKIGHKKQENTYLYVHMNGKR